MPQTEGIPIHIEWDKFKVGSSFFVPTLTPRKSLKDLLSLCRKMHMRVRGRRVLEQGMMGVRIWRLR